MRHPYIQCLTCGKRSYHPVDIRERFCGYCRVWHKDELTYKLGETFSVPPATPRSKQNE
jgi:hypothetical protein